MDLNLDGRVAIVTGASRGLGQAAARALAKEGARVLAVARSEDDLSRLAAEAAGRIQIQRCDMRDPQQVTVLADRALAAFGRIDIVVNNAGISPNGKFLEQDFRVWEDVIAVNLTAPALLTRAVGPHFVKQRSGKVINISSLVSVRGKANMVAY